MKSIKAKKNKIKIKKESIDRSNETLPGSKESSVRNKRDTVNEEKRSEKDLLCCCSCVPDHEFNPHCWSWETKKDKNNT